MQCDHLLEEDRFGARDVLDGLAGEGIRQKADEVARMTGLERDADLAVGLEPTDARAVARAGIDDHEGPTVLVDLDPLRRHDPDERVVHRALEPPAIDDQLHLVVEDIRRGLGEARPIGIAALTHDVPKQYRPLGGVRHVVDAWRKSAESRSEAFVGRGNLIAWHGSASGA